MIELTAEALEYDEIRQMLESAHDTPEMAAPVAAWSVTTARMRNASL